MKLERTTEDRLRNKDADEAWHQALKLVQQVWDKERDMITKLQEVFEPVRNLWRDVKDRAIQDAFRHGFLYRHLARNMEHLVRERVYDRASKVIGYHFRPVRCWREGDLVSVVAEQREYDACVIFTYYKGGKSYKVNLQNANQVRAEFVKFLATRLSRHY